MDPVSMIFSFFLQNPQMAVSAAERALMPGTVNVHQMQGSLVDLSRGVLHCYHRTARFSRVDYLGAPFARQGQYGAERSMVLRIHYVGIGAVNQYQMVVAVMSKDEKVRTAVIGDNAVIPYNKRCGLEEWVAP